MPTFFPLRVVLRDETPAVVRQIVPEDVMKFAEGVHRLSAESRVRRFFCDKTRLSGKEIQNLTQCDGQMHFGFVLGILGDDGNETDTVAVARCFRNREKPSEGEAAVATIDAWQRLGIGTILVQQLARACRALGVHTWKICEFTDNCAVRKIMAKIGSQSFEREIGSGILESIYELRTRNGDSVSESILPPA